MAKVKKIPQRKCVGCQTLKNKKELLRIVRTPEGDIAVDPTGKKSGRGVYICSNQDCFKNTLKGKRLEKALGKSIPPEVIETIKEVLENGEKGI